MTQTRVEYGMPPERYHADPALGNSGISALLESPRHYWARYLNPQRPPQEPTKAMAFGTLVHTMALERTKVDERYVVRPAELDGRTKDGKAWLAGIGTRQAVDIDTFQSAQSASNAILSLPDVRRMLERGHSETSAFWRDDSGVDCKCRPDWTHPIGSGEVVLLDLKTARDASPKGFSKAVAEYGYHRQAAWYSRGVEAASGLRVVQFVFVVVENVYPFTAAAYTLDADSLQQGADECDAAVELLRECRTTWSWPGYGSNIQEISLPPWARASNEVEVSYAD